MIILILLLLLSIVNHHSPWSSSCICDKNENDFMKGNQQKSLYWHSRRFNQGRNRKFYNQVRSITELLQAYKFFSKGKNNQNHAGFFILNDAILTCREKCSTCNKCS
jgi:hypothetical protein